MAGAWSERDGCGAGKTRGVALTDKKDSGKDVSAVEKPDDETL